MTTVTNLCKMGALGPDIAEPIFDKHTLGESDTDR